MVRAWCAHGRTRCARYKERANELAVPSVCVSAGARSASFGDCFQMVFGVHGRLGHRRFLTGVPKMPRSTTKADFATDTLTFMTEYSVAPYHGGDLIPSQKNDGKLELIELDKGLRKQKLSLLPNPGNEKGSYLLSKKSGDTEIQFLPWMSSKIVGTDVAGSPKIFFTAAVAGCSVFVVGSPANPTVFHAGIDGMIDAKVYPAVQGDDPQAALEKMLVGAAKSKDAPMFWRVLLSKLVPETLDDKDIGETNKEHYMEEGKHGKEIYAPFLARMKDKAKTAGMTLTFSTGYGCIFGVNKGGWKFYRQLNYVVQYTHKRHGRFQTCVPVSVRQFFPKGQESKELRPAFEGFEDPFTPSDVIIKLG
jgi:hypothetical protein